MSPHALLVLALVAHLMPEHLADLTGQSHAAWHYVAYGIEAGVLWLIVGVSTSSIAVQAVAAYGAMEGAQRAACRLALPMDRAPHIPDGQTLCDVATGLPMSLSSLIAAAVIVVVADISRRPSMV